MLYGTERTRRRFSRAVRSQHLTSITKSLKVFEDCTFPALDLDYEVVQGADNHPVVFRDCIFEGVVSFDNADVKLPLRFEDSEMDGLSIQYARFEYDIEFEGSTITGPVDGYEAWFNRDVSFSDVTFETEVSLEEASLEDDSNFAGARFKGPASFRGAEFAGVSNLLNDNASFDKTVFEEKVKFDQARFQASSFVDATFRENTRFKEVIFEGDTEFNGVKFEGETYFDEVECHDDISFESVVFEALARFRGGVFEGGARTLEDDIRFTGSIFQGEVDFQDAEFRYVNFTDAVFRDIVHFEGAWFDADADFNGVIFEDEVDFDETRFIEDADFSECVFEGQAVFRGAEFQGHAKHLRANATFEGVTFAADVDFTEAEFTSANFIRTEFNDTIDFTGATFEDSIDIKLRATGTDRYVNFTDSTIKGGTITQPESEEEWVRYDVTRASLGDIDIQVDTMEEDRELLDYFRFCKTVFDEFGGNEFDFKVHTTYLDRNQWNLHDFEDRAGREYAEEMTPATIETTYLNAKNTASAAGDMTAAGEFRIKRQQHARKKHLAIAADSSVDMNARIMNGVRGIENLLLGVTCGHGIRLFRIFGVFALTPAFFAVLYAFGGDLLKTDAGQLSSISALLTPEGQSIFFKNLHFSYITYLTVGYGNLGPKGAIARLLAWSEVYISVILGGLVLYTLIKRSEM
ncbi:MAG: pentapeptide repeat-containing protein [Halobacteria archaeon]|nr:pentapeptide repeat-containing protein [Halobacteria archaeon]